VVGCRLFFAALPRSHEGLISPVMSLRAKFFHGVGARASRGCGAPVIVGGLLFGFFVHFVPPPFVWGLVWGGVPPPPRFPKLDIPPLLTPS